VSSTPLLRLHFDPRGDLLEEARACESDVFLQWYGNTRAQLNEEYGGYEPSSVFLALADDGGDVHGVARLISPSSRGLKTLVDLERPPWELEGRRSAAAAGLDPARTWDVGTLGIRSGLAGRGAHTAASLYHGLVLTARANDVRSFVGILDDRLRRLLLSMGIVLNTLPGAGSGAYLGSPRSTPIYAHFAALLDHQRRVNPEAHRLVTLGAGLDLATPDPTTFVLRPKVVDLTGPTESSAELSDALTGSGPSESR
jgi:hypothetical protein